MCIICMSCVCVCVLVPVAGLVQRAARRPRRDVLGALRRRHGHRARHAAGRHLVQLPALPAPQRLPAHRRWVDTWCSFPLFQLLNDYLRTDGEQTRGTASRSSSSSTTTCAQTVSKTRDTASRSSSSSTTTCALTVSRHVIQLPALPAPEQHIHVGVTCAYTHYSYTVALSTHTLLSDSLADGAAYVLGSPDHLCGGKFHNHLRDVFAPQVVRYVDLMESSIAQSIHKGFEKENWKPQGWVPTLPASFRL